MDFPMMPTPIKLIFFTLFSSLSALCFYNPESEYNSAKHPRTDAIFILPAFRLLRPAFYKCCGQVQIHAQKKVDKYYCDFQQQFPDSGHFHIRLPLHHPASHQTFSCLSRSFLRLLLQQQVSCLISHWIRQ